MIDAQRGTRGRISRQFPQTRIRQIANRDNLEIYDYLQKMSACLWLEWALVLEICRRILRLFTLPRRDAGQRRDWAVDREGLLGHAALQSNPACL